MSGALDGVFSRRSVLVGGVTIAAGLALTACAGSGSAARAVTLRWAFLMPTTWDPVTSHTGNDVNQLSLAYASLTRLKGDGSVEAGLATDWEYTPDGKNVTFTLRPGLTFSDGTALDAESVVAFFERGQKQSDSYVKAQITDVASVTADSTTRFTIHLTKADYQIPYLVAGRSGMITSPAAAAKDVAKLNTWPVGAGPFTITDFVPESHASFTKNPTYWNAKNVHIETVQLSTAPDASTLVAGIQSATIDVASLPSTKVGEAKAAGLNVTVDQSLTVYDVSVNATKAPFDDPKVVEAFRYAIDRDEFVKVMSSGTGKATNQPFPTWYAGNKPSLNAKWNYDPKKAKAILAGAGYSPGDVSVTITTQSATTTSAEILQDQLKQVGITSTIKVIAAGSSTWQNSVYIAKDAEIAMDSTVGRESPVQMLLAVYGTAGILNLSNTQTDAFTAAITKVQETPIESPDYQDALQAAVEAGVEGSATNYIYSQPWIVVSSSRVGKLNLTPSQFRWDRVTLS